MQWKLLFPHHEKVFGSSFLMIQIWTIPAIQMLQPDTIVLSVASFHYVFPFHAFLFQDLDVFSLFQSSVYWKFITQL